MATDTDSVHDTLTRLRMKMVQQKIANEREKLNRPSTTESENDYDEQAKLQQAMLRRQELLDKIKHEQITNEEYRRPRTYSARHRYTPSPLPPPPSRRSLPDFNRNHYRDNRGDQTYREPNNNYSHRDKDMSQVKHVIEHRAPSPSRQYHLPPLQVPPLPVVQQPPPYMSYQQPIYQPAVPPLQDNRSMYNKSDWMDMMMMQNHQMHQLVVQQMMLHSLPGGRSGGPSVSYMSEPAPVVRSPAVHHHHYQMAPASQPPVHHYTSLPPLEPRVISPMRASAEPRIVRSGGPAVLERPVLDRQRSLSPGPRRSVKIKKKIPFPGPKPLRKFRHAAYAAWFIATLKANAKKNIGNRPSSVFLFGIILKEIVAALHRIYLNPSGNIYPVLADIINPKCYDLTNMIRGKCSDKEMQVMLQELQYIIENLIYHMTEIMPSTGVLGTHRKSAVYELIKSGKRFPDGYFWQAELDRLQFTENGRTCNLGDQEAFMLIVGIFISRSMVTTLLMKPFDYGLSSQKLTDVAERNLKIVATTLLYLVRRVTGSRGRSMMGMPMEISRYLYTDEEMRPIFSRIAKSFNYAEGLLREWGQEFIKRLRQAPYAIK